MARRLIWSTLSTMVMAAVLLGLGAWQVERLRWKDALIAERQAGLSQAPVILPGPGRDFSGFDFRPVLLRGRFLHARELFLINRNRKGRPGLHVITPFERQPVHGGGIVLVDRGWLPVEARDPFRRAEGQLEGELKISGIARLGEYGRGSLTPQNDPQKGVWFTPDAGAMGRILGLEVLPLIVEAGSESIPGGLPMGGLTSWNIKNNHLSYAFTWFALAVALIGIYIIFVVRLLRESTGNG